MRPRKKFFNILNCADCQLFCGCYAKRTEILKEYVFELVSIRTVLINFYLPLKESLKSQQIIIEMVFVFEIKYICVHKIVYIELYVLISLDKDKF